MDNLTKIWTFQIEEYLVGVEWSWGECRCCIFPSRHGTILIIFDNSCIPEVKSRALVFIETHCLRLATMAAKDETNERGYHSVPLTEDSEKNSIEDDLSSSPHSLKEYHHGQRTITLMWTFIFAFLVSVAINIGFVGYHSRGPVTEDTVLLTPVPNSTSSRLGAK